MSNTLTATRPVQAPVAPRPATLRERIRARRAHRAAVSQPLTAYPATRGVGMVLLTR